MKKILFYIGTGLFLLSCNNNTDTNKEEAGSNGGHAGHAMNTTAGNYCDSVNTGLIPEDTLKGSPHRTAMATINKTHVHIEYSSPGVKGRTIWGGLVAYDQVWVAGAHQATRIQFSKDVQVESRKIPAGTYALFAIPGKEKWTMIINSRYDQHLADDYTEKEDILRIQVTPGEHEMTPRLTYTVDKIDETNAVITLLWEKIHIHIPFATIN